jgi:hypothetical protein
MLRLHIVGQQRWWKQHPSNHLERWCERGVERVEGGVRVSG